MARPALKLADDYRSHLEEDIAKQLTRAGVKFVYEGFTIPYTIPSREAKYLPDFASTRNKIIIEGKGHFGAGGGRAGRWSNMKENSAREREKFALLKEQHPEVDIRFVFSKANRPIYKGSPTTHAKWAESHGFLWCEKVIPSEWIKELKGK